MLAFIAGFFVLALTIVAFLQVGWFYSIITILFTGSIIILVRFLWAKMKNKDVAEIISRVIIIISMTMIGIGIVMFLYCFLNGPKGYVGTFTECGWCGGSGIVSGGKICKLCDGLGGAYGASARFTATNLTWLGVLIVASGIAIIVGTIYYKNKDFSQVRKKRSFRVTSKAAFIVTLIVGVILGYIEVSIASNAFNSAYNGLLSFIVGNKIWISGISAAAIWLIVVIVTSFIIAKIVKSIENANSKKIQHETN